MCLDTLTVRRPSKEQLIEAGFQQTEFDENLFYAYRTKRTDGPDEEYCKGIHYDVYSSILNRIDRDVKDKVTANKLCESLRLCQTVIPTDDGNYHEHGYFVMPSVNDVRNYRFHTISTSRTICCLIYLNDIVCLGRQYRMNVVVVSEMTVIGEVHGQTGKFIY